MDAYQNVLSGFTTIGGANHQGVEACLLRNKAVLGADNFTVQRPFVALVIAVLRDQFAACTHGLDFRKGNEGFWANGDFNFIGVFANDAVQFGRDGQPNGVAAVCCCCKAVRPGISFGYFGSVYGPGIVGMVGQFVYAQVDIVAGAGFEIIAQVEVGYDVVDGNGVGGLTAGIGNQYPVGARIGNVNLGGTLFKGRDGVRLMVPVGQNAIGAQFNVGAHTSGGRCRNGYGVVGRKVAVTHTGTVGVEHTQVEQLVAEDGIVGIIAKLYCDGHSGRQAITAVKIFDIGVPLLIIVCYAGVLDQSPSRGGFAIGLSKELVGYINGTTPFCLVIGLEVVLAAFVQNVFLFGQDLNEEIFVVNPGKADGT